LGTGATARSALLAISRSFTTPEVQIWGRSSQNVNGILGFAEVIGLQATAMKKNLEFDLIVSTLPSNAYDEVSDDLSTTKLANSYFDVAYNPWPSAGSKYWNERAINHISGIHMLVWQAIAQIRIFLNGSLDVEIDSEPQLSQVMLSAAYDALK
jgi:shikimate dehydrogenase